MKVLREGNIINIGTGGAVENQHHPFLIFTDDFTDIPAAADP